jgi:hypothetical protein
MTTGNGKHTAVSNTGIALVSTSGSSRTTSNNNDISLMVHGSNLMVMGKGYWSAVSNIGIAMISSGTTSIVANAFVVTVTGSTTSLSATPLSSGTSLGFFAIPSPQAGSFTANILRIQACNSSVAGVGSHSALGSIPSTSASLSLSNVSVTSTTPKASSVSCLSFVPINGSVFDGVTVSCPSAGWAPGLGAGSSFSNVHVQRMVLNGTALDGQNVPFAQSLLPGLQADAFDTSTNASMAAFSSLRDTCAAQIQRWQRNLAVGSRTVTRSLTASVSSTPDAETPQKHRSALSRVLGEEAEDGVTSVAVAASVVCAGVFSTSAVTRVPIMRALASSIQCGWVDHELDERPSYLDLPLQFVSVGDSELRYYGGGVVLCGLFVLLWELVSLLCFKKLQGRLHLKAESVLGFGSILWQGYLVLNVVQVTVIVWLHADAGGWAAVFASTVVLLAVFGYSVAKWLWLLLPSQFTAHFPTISISHSKDGTLKIEYSTGSAASDSWLRFFGPMFEDTVDPGRMICRVVVMEEVMTGVLLSVLAGVKPEHHESCRSTAALMFAVTVVHLLYLLVFRPYRTKLDALFANINAFLMFCQGALAVIITVKGLAEGPLVTCFGIFGLLQLLLPVLQLMAGALYSRIRQSRRRAAEPEVDTAESEKLSSITVREGEDGTDTNLESSLLKVQ